jgi:hypothetical protein
MPQKHARNKGRENPYRSLLVANNHQDIVCRPGLFLRLNIFRINRLASFIRDAVFYKVGPGAAIVTY